MDNGGVKGTTYVSQATTIITTNNYQSEVRVFSIVNVFVHKCKITYKMSQVIGPEDSVDMVLEGLTFTIIRYNTQCEM